MLIIGWPDVPAEEEHLNMRATDRGREILQAVSARVSVQERTTTGAMRYCDICKCIKPDRAHHCSMCMQVAEQFLIWTY